MPRSDDDYRRDDDRDFDPPPRKSGSGGVVLILGIIAGVLLLCCGGGGVALFFATRKVREAADRMVATNDMKQIGLACHDYESKNGAFPTNSYAPDGKPLLSWRVHILPFLEQDNLYKQFHLNEPWDSPANRRLLDQMPIVYASQDERTGKKPKGNQTHIRGFSNPGTVFERGLGAGPPRKQFGFDQPLVIDPPKGVPFAKVTSGDGGYNTILALHAAEAIEWTKPEGLDASPGKPFPALLGIRSADDRVLVLFADGSVRAVMKSQPEAQWRAATTYNGGEKSNLVE